MRIQLWTDNVASSSTHSWSVFRGFFSVVKPTGQRPCWQPAVTSAVCLLQRYVRYTVPGGVGLRVDHPFLPI